MIQSVANSQGLGLNTQVNQVTNQTNGNEPTFAEFLKESINQLNESQVTSDKMTETLANGGNVELHQVYIAAQKASVSMTAALEFRNKAVEAYQEIMRMTV